MRYLEDEEYRGYVITFVKFGLHDVTASTGSWIVDADTKREAFEEIKKEMDRSLEERKCRKHMK